VLLLCTHLPCTAEQGPGFVVHVVLEDEQLPEYGPSFKELDVAVTPESHSRLHVKISPSGVKRWEVPESVIKRWVWLVAWSEALQQLQKQLQHGLKAAPWQQRARLSNPGHSWQG
jgi:hypothetical protein